MPTILFQFFFITVIFCWFFVVRIPGGKKLYETLLQERFKDQTTKLKLEDVKLMEEERRLAKIEDMNEVKQQSKTAAVKAVGGSEPEKKKIPQGIKEMELQDPNRKRIFIRSRL